jgi:hypothetical protein
MPLLDTSSKLWSFRSTFDTMIDGFDIFVVVDVGDGSGLCIELSAYTFRPWSSTGPEVEMCIEIVPVCCALDGPVANDVSISPRARRVMERRRIGSDAKMTKAVKSMNAMTICK